jgi:thioredoxin-like negative regulator of GroEL
MVLVDSPPVLIPFRKAVLLVFMPSKKADYQQFKRIGTLVDALQRQFGEAVRVLKLDEEAHTDVIRCFAITCCPAFVLVQQGVELWRHEGLTDEHTLWEVPHQLLAAREPLS